MVVGVGILYAVLVFCLGASFGTGADLETGLDLQISLRLGTVWEVGVGIQICLGTVWEAGVGIVMLVYILSGNVYVVLVYILHGGGGLCWGEGRLTKNAKENLRRRRRHRHPLACPPEALRCSASPRSSCVDSEQL